MANIIVHTRSYERPYCRQWQFQIGVDFSHEDIINYNILARFSFIWTTTYIFDRNIMMCAQDKTINITSLLTSTLLWPCGNADAASTTSVDRGGLGL